MKAEQAGCFMVSLLMLVCVVTAATGDRSTNGPANAGYWARRNATLGASIPPLPSDHPARDTNLILVRLEVQQTIVTTELVTHVEGRLETNVWNRPIRITNYVVGYRSGSNVIEIGKLSK